MRFQTALNHYVTVWDIARALDITPQAIYGWKKRGVVPIGSAARLQELTDGKLQVDPTAYVRGNAGNAGA